MIVQFGALFDQNGGAVGVQLDESGNQISFPSDPADQYREDM
jgi:hypothetical protein